MNFIAASTIELLSANAGVILGAIIVLIGVLLGLNDLLRFSAKRIWAISSVSFRESIRRRVLWVTPLAMLGIIAVTQLSQPFDEEDAIRQATKYCLFASGVVVVIATLILACTNLPKEIENRVIYTIVTKPTTRLEIVLGKTLGFARTSALILLVMGLFSFVYLQFSASRLQTSIAERLKIMAPGDIGRETLQHYANEGLLQSRDYARPTSLMMYARTPAPGDKVKWVFGANEQEVLFPFEIPDEIFGHDPQLIFTIELQTKQRPLRRREMDERDPSAATRPATSQPAVKMPTRPKITATLLNNYGETIATEKELLDVLHLSESTKADAPKGTESVFLEYGEKSDTGRAIVVAPQKIVDERIAKIAAKPPAKRLIFLLVRGTTLATQYGIGPNAVTLSAQVVAQDGKAIVIPINSKPQEQKSPIFRGLAGNTKPPRIRGDSDREEAAVAVFDFQDAHISGNDETVPFEFRSKIERNGVETTEAENVTNVEVELFNRKTGATTPPIMITPDSDRPTFFRAPRAAVKDGEFEVRVRSRSDGHYVAMRNSSIAVVSSTESFILNLAKSLLILWLLSVLVVVVAIFCSTFVSWPIAVVLSLVILLGRWSFNQIGDTGSPRGILTDIYPNADAVTSKLFTSGLGALNDAMKAVAAVLPDTEQFRVTEDIERGVTIPLRSLWDATRTLGIFGIPLLLLAYIFLKHKEVAP